MKDYVTPRKFAELTGWSRASIVAMLARGDIAGAVKEESDCNQRGHRWWLPVSEVGRWMKK